MAKSINYEPSRTLMEFRLLPGLTGANCFGDQISLRTPLVWSGDNNKKYYLNIPLVSAAMQSVSVQKWESSWLNSVEQHLYIVLKLFNRKLQ
jgi:hypothetical protein